MTTHTNLIARLRSGWTTDRLLAANALESLEQQNAELVAALEKIAAMDYRKSAVNLFGRIAHEIVNVALSKVKQPSPSPPTTPRCKSDLNRSGRTVLMQCGKRTLMGKKATQNCTTLSGA